MKPEKKGKLNTKIYVFSAIAFFAVIVFFAGCKGEKTVREEIGTATPLILDNSGSGSAISQQSVSGSSISGSSILLTYDMSKDSTKKEREQSAGLNVMSFNARCNSSNYYELDNGDDDDEDEEQDSLVSYIYQKNLDGTIIEKHKIEDYVSHLLWVDDRELFYTTRYEIDDDSYADLLWRVPIQKTKERDKVQWKKTKRVLKLKEEYGEIYEDDFYADENYILFISSDYELKLYDRKKDKFIKIKDVSDKKSFLAARSFDGASEVGSFDLAVRPAMWNNVFFLTYKYSGIRSYRLGDDRVKQIVMGSIDENGEQIKEGKLAYASYPQFLDEKSGRLFYQVTEVGKDKQGSEDENLQWMVYDCEKKEKKTLLTQKQWEKLLRDTQTYDLYLNTWSTWEKKWQKEDLSYESEDAQNSFPNLFMDIEGETLYACCPGVVLRLDPEAPTDSAKAEYLEGLSNFMLNMEVIPWYDIKGFHKQRCYLEYSYYLEGEELEKMVSALDEEDDEEYEDEELEDEEELQLVCNCDGYFDLKKNEFVELFRGYDWEW